LSSQKQQDEDAELSVERNEFRKSWNKGCLIEDRNGSGDDEDGREDPLPTLFDTM
jgi:hypothetical protein